MPLRLAVATRDALVRAVAQLVDDGPGPALVHVYSGAQPGGIGQAAGTLLLSFELNDPAYHPPFDGRAGMNLDPSPEAVALGPGSAGWFRVVNSAGATVLEGEVGSSANVGGAPGQLTLSLSQFVGGEPVQITSGSLAAPAA